MEGFFNARVRPVNTRGSEHQKKRSCLSNELKSPCQGPGRAEGRLPYGRVPAMRSVSTGIQWTAAVIRLRGLFSLSRPGDGQWTADDVQSVTSPFFRGLERRERSRVAGPPAPSGAGEASFPYFTTPWFALRFLNGRTEWEPGEEGHRHALSDAAVSRDRTLLPRIGEVAGHRPGGVVSHDARTFRVKDDLSFNTEVVT